MKNLLALCFFIWTFSIAQAQEVKHFVSVSAFYKEGQPYVECMFIIKGNGLVYQKNDQGTFVASVLSKVEFFVNGQLYETQEYIFTSNAFRDDYPLNKPDILELKEIPVPNNQYFVQVTVQDMNTLENTFSYSEEITVDFLDYELAISNISFFSSYNKNPGRNKLEKYGFYFVPLYNNHVPAHLSEFSYSYEVYNSDLSCGEAKKILFNTYIENYENGLLALPSVQKLITFQTNPKILCYDAIDISQLPTGKYYLMVQIMDNNNCLIGEIRKMFTNENPNVQFLIEKYNSGKSVDSFVEKIPFETLQKYILMLAPISTPFESEFFKNNMETCSLVQLQNYFYTFWYVRNNANPEQAWNYFLEKNK
jgi:hypothetical protein